ncbi:protein hu-li tai shao isoform X3 [Tetranychus urticae]|uniref:Class II aldolase/adducin N-terminal domain-containing protein n=1 Tax=Tetranychus urticae TaxID=32264 RepID=T1K2E8_TETUR|nr:protein hu-li tai shao isoform X3 [Tetranychus urticae]
MEVSKTTRKANGDFNISADSNQNNDPSSSDLAADDYAMNQVNKPPDIEQDLKEMERRKRVEMVINSQLFREELERIIESQINEGYAPSSLSALQQVTELLLPNSAKNSSLVRFGSSAIPINDIRGVDAFNYAKGEKLLRCKLAAVYRLVDLYGWSQSIYNHVSVRVSQDQEHFLLNPFGLQYHEVTASSLLKVDMQGNVINPGSTNFGFNRAGFVLHSAVHSARPDIKAIIHIHHPTCVAISSMKCGLLKISQESAIIGDVSYHEFKGIVIDPDERESIARNLGPFNKVLFLRNHGVLTCGESIEEALHLMQNVVLACETQVKISSIGLDNIYQMTKESVDQVRSVVKSSVAKIHGTGKIDENEANKAKTPEDDGKEKLRKWKVWDLEFEAQMRMLDNAGFRTGYIYRQPLLRADQQRPKYDVEIPPAATSLHQYFEGDKWLSPLKKLVDGKKTQDKLKWVNSPNSYQKVEISETGTLDPKKITKWVQDSSPSHSNPVKIDNHHQFVPVNVDPGEFKRRQKEMKQVRMQNKISGGPQSHILEGGTWEELNKRQSGDETDHVVLVGAASKGIIQREYQHNATVYKSAYAKNPFDNVSDQELDEYKKYIEKKQRGEPVDDVPDRFRHLLLEPVAEHMNEDQITSPVEQISKSPQSPLSDEDSKNSNNRVHRSHSARLAAQAAEDNYFARRFKSERKPKYSTSDTAVNGEEKLGDVSGASRSSKEGSPVKDLSEDKSSSKKDKKKKGIRTPSFLKKKKHKKEKELA